MKSETTEQHKKISSDDITCGIITLSDSRKSEKLDLSGKIISEEIESRYTLKAKSLIPDEKEELVNEFIEILTHIFKIV